MFIPQNLAMIWMFGNFYYRTYIRAPKKTNTSGEIKSEEPKKHEQESNFWTAQLQKKYF